MSPVRLDGLSLRIPTDKEGRPAWVRAATEVSLDLPAGAVTTLVGESGSGKSVLASTLVGLVPPGTRVSGSLRIHGQEMAPLLGRPRDRRWQTIRRHAVALVTQSAATTFTPTRRLGSQVAETIRARNVDTPVGAVLERVGLPARVARAYPHEISGGMAVRLGVALALVGGPDVLVADEPTAGLDPHHADLVHHLLRDHADAGHAVLLITHDLARLIDAAIADAVAVMYAGRVVENGPAARTIASPRHPYTRALLDALPRNGLHPVPGEPPSLVTIGGTAEDATEPEPFEARLARARGGPWR